MKNLKQSKKIPGSIETQIKLERGRQKVTGSALGTEKGNVRLPVRGLWQKKTGSENLGIDKGMTEEINTESKILLKGSKEGWVDQILEEFYEVK